MSEHTPGPWKASEGVPSDIWHVDMPDRQFSITVSRGGDDWDMTVEEVQANARLIAAAPALLAASRGQVTEIARLRKLVLEMGHVIRSLDEEGDHVDYWTNDGNEHGPEYNSALPGGE